MLPNQIPSDPAAFIGSFDLWEREKVFFRKAFGGWGAAEVFSIRRERASEEARGYSKKRRAVTGGRRGGCEPKGGTQGSKSKRRAESVVVGRPILPRRGIYGPVGIRIRASRSDPAASGRSYDLREQKGRTVFKKIRIRASALGWRWVESFWWRWGSESNILFVFGLRGKRGLGD